jgi:methionyl aminopeptidase
VPIPIRSPREIEGLRRAGAALWSVLDRLVAAASPGVRTSELAALAAARIAEAGAEPIFPLEGTPLFPAAAVITINEEVAHAPPGARALRSGDLVTIDAGLRLHGWCADASRILIVGGPGASPEPGGPPRPRLAGASVALTDSLAARVRPGVRWADLAAEAARSAAAQRVTILRGFKGHGIGRELHEAPALDVHDPVDLVLRPGMVFTLEPIVTTGRGETARLPDGWTHITADRAPACYTERTIAVTRTGFRVLTAP